LSFTIYDNLGNPIDSTSTAYENVVWTVPIENTLLKIDDSYQGDIDSTLTKKRYQGIASLAYEIAEIYDINKNDNTI